LLRESSPGKRVAAGAQGGDKKARRCGLSGNRIRYGDRLAGIIDKEFFPGPVGLAKADVERVAPLMVSLAELTVLISVRVGLSVFQPQQTEDDPLAGQFLMDVLHRRQPYLPGSARALPHIDVDIQGHSRLIPKLLREVP
jgi:hypothetical protein